MLILIQKANVKQKTWIEETKITFFHLFLCFRSFIPDKNMVFCPEQLLRVILAHIHYMPDHWQGNAHRYETRDQFSQLFQYKAVSIKTNKYQYYEQLQRIKLVRRVYYIIHINDCYDIFKASSMWLYVTLLCYPCVPC